MRLAADTNVYVYLSDDQYTGKQAVARELVEALARCEGAVALQVVGEVQNALRRRLKMPNHLAQQQARNVYVSLPSFGYDNACVERALAQAGAGRLSYWDALLLAACDRAGIDVLFSEDLQDGFVFGGVRVVNPFAPDGMSKTAQQLLEGYGSSR